MRAVTGSLLRSSRHYIIPRSVATLQAGERAAFRDAAVAVGSLTALAILVLAVLPTAVVIGLVGAAAVLPALLVWLWRQPVRGVYVLLAAAVMQEIYYPTSVYADDLGRFIPFFEDISTVIHSKGVAVSPAEIFMIVILLLWPLKAIARREFRFDSGTLWRPLGLYMLMVLISELHGLMTGGNFTTSLWEIRAQVYMFVMYILACNLVKTRRHVDVLGWILLLGAGIKGVQGTWRYLITLHGSLHGVQELFPHEQSFFYNAFIVFVPILFLYGGSRRMKRAALYLLPFVLLASLANQRRAAVAALVVGLFSVLLVTLVAHPPRRHTIIKILLVLAVVLPPYYVAFYNKQGLTAEPARAIASIFHPDKRDAGSNQYRINEASDILFTMRTNPLIGYGFGKPMLTPYPLVNISNIYVWYLVLPHNSVLWVWMRLGTIGYVLFWFLIGTAIVQAARLVRRLDDPYLKGLAVLIIALVLQEVVFGYVDLQWTSYRNLITIGVLFALIGRLTTVASAQTRSTAPAPAESGTLRVPVSRARTSSLRGT